MIKKIIGFFICLLIVSIGFAAITSDRFATREATSEGLSHIVDHTNWDEFYETLINYCEVFKNTYYCVDVSNSDSPIGKDYLTKSENNSYIVFIFYSSINKVKISFYIYIDQGSVPPYSSRPFIKYKEALKYWNELMDKYNGVIYEE